MQSIELEKVDLSGGKRLSICPSEWKKDIWIVHGKDEVCQAEGTWEELVSLAEQILSHPNTDKIKIKTSFIGLSNWISNMFI